jgi:murein DD-endopeptidase MepM/ murein hydrolase activator NlpD
LRAREAGYITGPSHGLAGRELVHRRQDSAGTGPAGRDAAGTRVVLPRTAPPAQAPSPAPPATGQPAPRGPSAPASSASAPAPRARSAATAREGATPRETTQTAPRRPRKGLSIVVGPVTVLTVAIAFASLAAYAVFTTGVMLFGDKLSARLVAQQSDMQFAYEQKLVVFRAQLDRFARQTRVDRDSIEGQIADLMLRQAALEARQAMLTALAEQTRAGDGTQRQAQAVAPRSGFAVLDASHPAAQRAQHLERSMTRVEGAQVRALAGFMVQSQGTLARLQGAFTEVGLDPELFSPSRGLARGSVAALLPAGSEVGGGPFEENYVRIRRTLSVLGRLRTAASAVPFQKPMGEEGQLSSPFGMRSDPFTGEGRMHAGLDFRAAEGAPIHAGASGVVLSASMAGGYGNLVQIDHGNGLVTRYAHLSSMLVTPGQPVAQGMLIGRVGSTGRSTGPHLHYETRLRDEPLDPMRFIRAGSVLFSQ